MIIQILGAFATVVSFSIVLEAPRKYIIYSGIIGAIGWWIYLLAQNQFVLIGAILWAGSGIALLSHIFARVLKAPVTIFLVPGILPIVPGASIYRCIFYMIQGDRAFSNFYFVETLQIAGAIALSIFVMDSIFRIVRKNP